MKPSPSSSPTKASPPAKAPTTQQELEDSIAQYIVDEKPLQVQGTVTAKDSFSAKTDCEVLRKAMKGLGTDEKAIVSVMGHRTFAQRQELIQTYKTLFSKDLQKELKSESSGNFKNVLMGLCQSPTEFMADQLRKAMKGAGTDEDCLIEILCTLSNAEMKAVSEAYTTMHNRVLEKDLTSELSGGLRTLLLSLLQANRPEGSKVDLRLAAKDAGELCAGGDKKTTETKFSSILVTRSYAQLRATFEEYKKVAKKDLADTIKAEFSGDVKKAMLAVVECIRDKAEHFARVLYESMAGAGTRDEALIRCVVLRSEVDMLQIKQKFEQKYKQPLGKMIVGDLSGPYKRLVLAMVGEEQYSKK
ncbi:hypothetical protein CAPTEDRAFT_153823 [Capitella teleta]|uniref:Annexin n=1 Tax=Capitella teleta TaxID=283909 RepID=R7U6X3_CAPTE|nr:hypothetical protein CAPTEDRAFT_153823 [Capitella teleta]|eukprot:ELT98870.1 hypothetical protein CAPTEDRAFT_153823 [Capitella teleta]